MLHPDDVTLQSDLVRWNFTPDAIEAFVRTLVEIEALPEVSEDDLEELLS